METAGVPKSGQSGTVSPSATKVYMLTVCVFLEWGCGAGLCWADYHFLKVMILYLSLRKEKAETKRMGEGMKGGGAELCTLP